MTLHIHPQAAECPRRQDAPGGRAEQARHLLDLAERCEKATGPNFRLEQEIWAAAVAKPPANLPALGNIKPPPYTASLDAAMTLVPEGYDWIIGRTNDGLTIHAEVGGRGDEYMRFGNTPALALCAAALRAKGSEQ